MIVASLIAQTSETSGRDTNPIVSLLPFIFLILLFWLLLIRPQRRRAQEHARLIQSVEVGDEVETVGGIFGTVRRLEPDALWVEISPGTTIKVARGAVRRKVVEQPEHEEPS